MGWILFSLSLFMLFVWILGAISLWIVGATETRCRVDLGFAHFCYTPDATHQDGGRLSVGFGRPTE